MAGLSQRSLQIGDVAGVEGVGREGEEVAGVGVVLLSGDVLVRLAAALNSRTDIRARTKVGSAFPLALSLTHSSELTPRLSAD